MPSSFLHPPPAAGENRAVRLGTNEEQWHWERRDVAVWTASAFGDSLNRSVRNIGFR